MKMPIRERRVVIGTIIGGLGLLLAACLLPFILIFVHRYHHAHYRRV